MTQFDRQAFLSAPDSERAALCQGLQQVLTERMKAEPEFHAGAHKLIVELRGLGHGLVSFDESDDMQVWCPDWTRPSGSGIVVTFKLTEHDGVGVVVEWSKERPCD